MSNLDTPTISASATHDFSKPLRFLIFGGTGPCGILLIRKALQVYSNSTVIVSARSPQKIPEDLTFNGRVKIVTGKLEELDKVEKAFEAVADSELHKQLEEPPSYDGATQPNTTLRSSKVDVILSALGPPVLKGFSYPSNHPIATFYGNLIDIMFNQGVKRLIVMCTASHPDPKDKLSGNPLTSGIVTIVKLFAHNAYVDFKEVGNIIRRKGGEAEGESSSQSGVPETDLKASKLDWTLVRVPVLTNQDKEDTFAGYVGDGKTGNALTKKAFAAFCVGEVEKREWVRKAPFICTPCL
ncbi:hypothetical protein CPB83DRAFT_856311 [Crepidotus variabilis]|uniref:NAD(P)-binding domain-containing protein n=1 Tax=Crepidotus variabilis TaxID=179855 RepID=A0A9P6JNZ6_9AGAR|nr:hypothetical protein CPB83DRAFT_856311 [Crepidotus variabilis]